MPSLRAKPRRVGVDAQRFRRPPTQQGPSHGEDEPRCSAGFRPGPNLPMGNAPLRRTVREQDTQDASWKGHPLQAALIRALALALPIAASVAATVALSRLFPP